MSGQHIGYIRVSTFEQNPDRQLDGIKLDRTFTDKVSGKTIERPALQEMLAFVRSGDTIFIHSMDRLARNLDDLRKIVNTQTERGVRFRFIKEDLSFSNEQTPMAQFMLSVMGAFAEFERALIKERQREGIELAKKRGAYRGRKKVLNKEQVALLVNRVKAGDKKAAIARDLGISRETLYQYLRAEQVKK